MTALVTGPEPPGFAAAWGLENAHAQTAYAAFLRRPRPLVLVRRRVELADGDFVDVDVASPGAGRREGAPWVLVLHGLEGSSESPYARGLAGSLVDAGYEACLMNYRGCSGVPNRLPRSYHSGETGDVRAVLAELSRERPGRPCALVGFSIGANLAMKLLGEAPPPHAVRGAVAISPPFDLVRGVRHVDRPAAFPYRERLLRTLRAKALEKLERFPGLPCSARQVRAASTFQEFDALYTAPVHGFRDAEDYWARSSGGRYLAGVSRPLVVLTASDDPFFPPGYVPREEISKNPCVELVLTERGGHVAFVSGSIWAPTFWAERLVLERLEHVLRSRP